MKKGLIIGPVVFVLCSFVWSGLNTYSQDVKKTSPLDRKIQQVMRDSVKIEQLKDTIALQRARKDSNIEKSAEITEGQKMVAEDLKQTNYLVLQTLRSRTSQIKESKVPIVFVANPKKKEAELNVNLQPPKPNPDSLTKPMIYHGFWNKLFHPFRRNND